MKKALIFLVLFIGLLPIVSAQETLIVKINEHLTFYDINGWSVKNCWNSNITIVERQSLIPDNSYFKSNALGSDYDVFSKNKNGVYFSGLEKLQLKYDSLFNNSYAKRVETEKEELRADYNKIFAENTRLINYKNILEITIITLVLIIMLLGLKILQKKFKKKFESATI